MTRRQKNISVWLKDMRKNEYLYLIKKWFFVITVSIKRIDNGKPFFYFWIWYWQAWGLFWEFCIARTRADKMHKKWQMDLYNVYKNLKMKQNILYDTYKNDSITIIKCKRRWADGKNRRHISNTCASGAAEKR